MLQVSLLLPPTRTAAEQSPMRAHRAAARLAKLPCRLLAMAELTALQPMTSPGLNVDVHAAKNAAACWLESVMFCCWATNACMLDMHWPHALQGETATADAAGAAAAADFTWHVFNMSQLSTPETHVHTGVVTLLLHTVPLEQSPSTTQALLGRPAAHAAM